MQNNLRKRDILAQSMYSYTNCNLKLEKKKQDCKIAITQYKHLSEYEDFLNASPQ